MAATEKKKFQVISGQVTIGKGKNARTYFADETFESDKPYDTVFKNKLRDVTDSKVKVTPKDPDAPNILAVNETPKEEKRKAEDVNTKLPEDFEEPNPDDVTADFEGASEAGYTVVKVGKKFNVFDHGATLNEAPLTKKEAQKLIEEMAA